MLGQIPRRRASEPAALVRRYPMGFAGVALAYARSPVTAPPPDFVGEYSDEWGAVFRCLEEGARGEVVRPPLADWSALESFAPPYSVLDGLDTSPSHASYRQTDKFLVCTSNVQPWQRVMFLRGAANALMDVGEESAEFRGLLSMVHEYYLCELQILSHASADGVRLKDDWGTQETLLVSPGTWRRLFKPLYAQYCQIIHAADKFAFFHSDGEISSIYPDLIEIGVDAINSQLFCMDIEGLARRYRGRLTLWGEIDRQHVLPFGELEDVRAAVQRVRRAWDDGQGGLIAQGEWSHDVPYQNIEAVYAAREEPLP